MLYIQFLYWVYCCTDELGHKEVQTQAVFTNSELSLKHVDVYGFDFDYTLLQYTPEVHKLIYRTARKRLVEKLSVRTCSPVYIMYTLYIDLKHVYNTRMYMISVCLPLRWWLL